MTSTARSSITGLHHPKRARTSLSFLDNQNSPTKTSAMDRMLYADRTGSLPSDSSRSLSSVDLSGGSSPSLEQAVLHAQIKRATSSNEVMQASLKRLRAESQNSIEDLKDKNESLERSLHQSRIKVSELEHQLDKSKQPTGTTTSMSVYQQQIQTLQNEKLELKLQLQHSESLHSKESNKLEQTIHELQHRLIDTENQLKLSQLEQDKLNSINHDWSHQLAEQRKSIEQLQKRVLELELLKSTLNRTNVVNQSLVDDVKRIHELRYENDQLKNDIELLRLKCDERILHDEELRTLRKQVDTSHSYRALIAKHEAEILKLREQLVNASKSDVT